MYTDLHTKIVSGIHDIETQKNITSKMKEILQYKNIKKKKYICKKIFKKYEKFYFDEKERNYIIFKN